MLEYNSGTINRLDIRNTIRKGEETREPTNLKGSVSLLQPTSNSVDVRRNYEYVTYVLSVKFKR